MSGPIPHRPATGETAVNISNAVVRLLAEYTGRGPTKAKTYINDDLITVVLRDSLTKGERSLSAHGAVDTVLKTRFAYQRVMSTELILSVEKHSGRRVIAFMSANHVDPDAAIESFILAPQGRRENDDPLPADDAGTPAAA
jgi:uncharacterized protein YbcI